MNIPTNKIKDLVAVLQTFDPDLTHHFTAAEVFETRSGRRYIQLRYDQSMYVPVNKLLDDLYAELSPDDYAIVEDINTVDEFKAALLHHLSTLHARVNELQNPSK